MVKYRKFVQICCATDSASQENQLYALDEAGTIWYYVGHGIWQKIGDKRVGDGT